MGPGTRPPEWVLEEMYRTGRKLMAARSRARDVSEFDGARTDGGALRDRFEGLVEEFLGRVERG